MAVTFIQNSVVVASTTPPNIAATFSLSPVSGNLIIDGASFLGATSGTATFSAATNGNALTSLDSYNSVGTQWVTVLAKIFGGTDNSTVTTVDSTSTFTAARTDLWEFSGMTATLDGTPQHSTTNALTAQSLGSITTTVNNELVFFAAGFGSNSGSGYTCTGFTLSTSVNQRYVAGYQIVATAGTVVSPTLGWATASPRCTATMMAFLPTASGLTAQQKSVGFFSVM